MCGISQSSAARQATKLLSYNEDTSSQFFVSLSRSGEFKSTELPVCRITQDMSPVEQYMTN